MSDSDSTGKKNPSHPPNCLKCAYFKYKWDPGDPTKFLRACEIFSIMCSNLPSYEVFRATRANCPSFRLKEGLKERPNRVFPRGADGWLKPTSFFCRVKVLWRRDVINF
jgi:hypothetical protein